MITLLSSLIVTGCARSGLAVINSLAKLGDYQVTRDIAYGEHPLQKLDVYVPENNQTNKPLPVVVFFYGGCWGGCNTYAKNHYQFIGDTFSKQGYVTVVADYRLYPEFLIDDILLDAAAVTEWTYQNIADYGGDAEQIFLMGHSAGAHMAAMVAFDQKRLSQDAGNAITGFIGLAGPYDFEMTEDYQRELFGPPERYAATQPINFIDGTEPPMLLLWGEKDTAVYKHNIVNLTAKVKQQNGEVLAKHYPDMSHTAILSSLSRPYRASKPTLSDIKAFITDVGDR